MGAVGAELRPAYNISLYKNLRKITIITTAKAEKPLETAMDTSRMTGWNRRKAASAPISCVFPTAHVSPVLSKDVTLGLAFSVSN